MRRHSIPIVGILGIVLGSIALGGIGQAAWAQTQAPDATERGPLATTSAEYKLPATRDALVAREIDTELWARVYRPASLGPGRHPLVVFLHGNHATCGRDAGAGQYRYDTSIEYTLTGTCPPGYVPVPSHDGYGYLADKLASHGYVVVSINANRGVNAAPGVAFERGLNLRRGRLVLRHLALLSDWSRGAIAPDLDAGAAALASALRGRLDFDHVGLMGHSRGGEGVRAAYNIYRDPSTDDPPGVSPIPYPTDWRTQVRDPITFEGIFEIGPVDGQTFRKLNADGVAWTVLLPMCDGDVYNLQGVRPFDRMLRDRADSPAAMKATYAVWGTNHNFYNTEWQTSDSAGCLGHKRLFGQHGGSAGQRIAAEASALAFFRGNVGRARSAAFNRNFDPAFALPAVVAEVTRVDRGYTDSPSTAITATIDDFNGPTGTSSSGAANTASGVSVAHGSLPDHAAEQRVAQIAWDGTGSDVYFQSNWAPAGEGRDASGYRMLELRVARQCGDETCRHNDNGWLKEAGFSIRLVGAAGELSAPVRLRDLQSLTGPVGGLVWGAGATPHPILQTVRIPLGAFGAGTAPASILKQLRGVRLVFDDTRRDEIYVGNIRLSILDPGAASVGPEPPAGADSPLDVTATSDDNVVRAIRRVKSSEALGGAEGVEIELGSSREIEPRGELLVLRIGDREHALARYGDDGDTRRVIFTLTPAEYAALTSGDHVYLQYGSGAGADPRHFGPLNKLQ